MICLLLTLRMAHKSLMLKLEARQALKAVNANDSTDQLRKLYEQEEGDDESNKSENDSYEQVEMRMVEYENNVIKDQNTKFPYRRPRNHSVLSRTGSIGLDIDTRVDKIYSIGCFDLFHEGHVKIISRMRELGKKVIIGVHDSRRLVC